MPINFYQWTQRRTYGSNGAEGHSRFARYHRLSAALNVVPVT